MAIGNMQVRYAEVGFEQNKEKCRFQLTKRIPTRHKHLFKKKIKNSERILP